MIFETETNRSIEEETVENIILQSTIEETETETYSENINAETAADIFIVSVQTGDKSFLNWWILFTTISLCCIFWILCAIYLTKKKK